MNRVFLIFTVALFYVSGAAFAQDTIKGKVVDRKGNPVVGTKITLKSGDIATTDFDGAFEIEASEKEKAVANCVGMQQKKVKMKDDMVIKLTETSAWNRKPTKFSPFVMLQGGISSGGYHNHRLPLIGIKAGMVKKIGFYASFVSTIDLFSGNKADVDISYGWITDRFHTLRALSLGGIVRLGCPLHICIGIGGYNLSRYLTLYPDINGNSHIALQGKTSYPFFESGLMLSFKHFSMDASVKGIVDGFTVAFGVGYKF